MGRSIFAPAKYTSATTQRRKAPVRREKSAIREGNAERGARGGRRAHPTEVQVPLQRAVGRPRLVAALADAETAERLARADQNGWIELD